MISLLSSLAFCVSVTISPFRQDDIEMSTIMSSLYITQVYFGLTV